MAYEVNCYEGLNSITISTAQESQLSDNTTLSELRRILENCGFLKKDQTYRFARKKVSSDGSTMDPTDLKLFNQEDEQDIPIKRLYGDKGEKRIQIANTSNSVQRKADYVGEYTTKWSKWFDNNTKQMTVEVQKVKKETTAPVMLQNVIRSNSGVDCYEFACICEEDSEIYFNISGAGACGNVYEVKIVGGNQSLGSVGQITDLDDEAYKFKSKRYDRWYGEQNNGQAIVVRSTDVVTGVDPETKLSYRIINFEIREITEWVEEDGNGHTIATHTVKDYKKKAKLNIPTITYYSLGNKDTYVVNPSDEKDATLTGGGQKGVSWSKSRFYTKTQLYGVISAHFFIFKDTKTAETYFKRYFG